MVMMCWDSSALQVQISSFCVGQLTHWRRAKKSTQVLSWKKQTIKKAQWESQGCRCPVCSICRNERPGKGEGGRVAGWGRASITPTWNWDGSHGSISFCFKSANSQCSVAALLIYTPASVAVPASLGLSPDPPSILPAGLALSFISGL